MPTRYRVLRVCDWSWTSAVVRQRGTQFHAGYGVGMGKDHTLFAKIEGVIKFEVKGAFNRRYVSVVAA
ncbi:50S ribosomal protein L27 [Pseudomonas fluorescens]|uniref:50S ribosomal protein L27 n=1 Tax=Pseudomonas fluorescens TaxID=294 RepID=UPI003CFEBA6F